MTPSVFDSSSLRCADLSVAWVVAVIQGLGMDVSTGARSASDHAESALLARLRAGEDAAFTELVTAESPRMFAVARRMLNNEADAADALQDAFVSAFKALDKFQGGSSLGTWLHSIVVRSALMKLRTRRRRDERPIEDYLPTFKEDGHSRVASPRWPDNAVDHAQRREVRELVRRKIDELPQSYREVLMLRDIEEIDTTRTAEVLGVSPTAVKVRLHRARQALKSLLDLSLTELI